MEEHLREITEKEYDEILLKVKDTLIKQINSLDNQLYKINKTYIEKETDKKDNYLRYYYDRSREQVVYKKYPKPPIGFVNNNTKEVDE